ncbi:MAG: DNA-methyltransferase [Phycisphaerae bacterium]
MNQPEEMDTIVNADCIQWLADQPEGWADLVFADPPFNIGYQYDVYEDAKAYDEYHDWTEQWMKASTRALKPSGSFWVAIGAEYAAEVRLIGRKLGLTLRNWIIWHYTFGQNTKAKFARSHVHLFYFVKDPKDFTFNDMAARTFSDRQRIYKDKRANPKGKMPDDVWSEFSRVCGTFKEREGWHPCQMPESVLTRIIRVSSNVGDVVFDPFGGSGTTLAAAKRNARHYLGTEVSPDYVKGIRRRLRDTQSIQEVVAKMQGRWPMVLLSELRNLYAEAGVTIKTLRANEHLLEGFARQYNARMAESGCDREFDSREILSHLDFLRAHNQLAKIKVHASESTSTKVKGLFD